MCGIAGIALNADSTITEKQKQALLQAIKHRGPDDQGIWQSDRITLLHTRLSIIDISGGKQPLTNDSQQILIANGEIYNNPELRKIFTDYPFQSHSDCEVILPLWQKFHKEFAEHLRGMYGIALVDGNNQKLILSRDIFGIKPLYYAEIKEGIVFASEAQAILKSGFVNADLNQSALQSLLQIQFSPGRETIYKGIFRLLPGETIIIQNGKITHRQRIHCYKAAATKITDKEIALQQFDEVFAESVRIHERSDVPFGLFLSSGIDSTILLKMMQRLGHEKRLHAWTARFETTKQSEYVNDETQQAALMAKEMGVDHHVMTISQKQVWDHLPKIIACMDDPVADYAIIPTWFLAKEASSMVKVILSGEGGDELFAGYGRYRKAIKPKWLGGKDMYSKGVFPTKDFFNKPLFLWRKLLNDCETRLIYKDETRLEKAQRIDLETWLPDDLLIKLDRCLMAHSVEGRVPFLDRKVSKFAAHLADELKVRNGQGKWLLRQWLQCHLSQAQPFVGKSGFTVPIGLWIEEQAEELAPLVAHQAGIQQRVDCYKILELFEKASRRKERFMAWNLLFYAIWHQIHIMGTSPHGNIIEVLRG